MNESNIHESSQPAAECCAEMDQYVRRNPTAAIAIAVGAGLAIGLLIRAMRPEPTVRDRMTHVLDELECRLRDAATPVLNRASALASDGLQQGEARLNRLVRDGRSRLRNLFS